jgi:hypothetical protein
MRFTTTIAATAFLLLAGAAQASTLEESLIKTYEVSAGSQIWLDNTNGAVEIRASGDNKVHLHATKRVEGWTSSALPKAMRELQIVITQDGGGLKIVTKYPHQSGDGFFEWLAGDHVNYQVQYELSVPRESNLQIGTVNGHIRIDDVSGVLKLETTNGAIEVARCRGAIDAETTNGHIRAELLNVTAGKAMHFETTNGGITVKVPRTFAAAIDAANTNGSISTDLPVSTNATHRHSLRGTVNGGGPELRLRTTNGGISIQTM